MTGKFRNGSTRGNMRVIITCGNKVDTLLNGLSTDGREKFNYEHVGLTTHILYYDIYE